MAKKQGKQPESRLVAVSQAKAFAKKATAPPAQPSSAALAVKKCGLCGASSKDRIISVLSV